MPQEVGGSGANFGPGGRKFEVVITEATKKGSGFGDVVGGVGVEDDDVVEVRGDAFQPFDDLVNDLTEPTGGGHCCFAASQATRRAGLACKTPSKRWYPCRW